MQTQVHNDSGDAPRRRVLVVDDNRDAADSIVQILGLWGYEVRAAYDGASAIQVAGEYRPGVVFLDLGLPGMNGFEVARRLRAEQGLGGTLLVAMTGHSLDEDRRQSQEAGCDCHLIKPVDPVVLRELLDGPKSTGEDS